MKKIVLLLLFIGAFCVRASAQGEYVGPKTRYVDGVCYKTFDVKKLNLEVSASKKNKKYGSFGKEIFFTVYVDNKQNDDLQVNPKLFKLSETKKGVRREVELYSFSDYSKKVNSFIFWWYSNYADVTETVKIKNNFGFSKSIEATHTEFTGDKKQAIEEADKYLEGYLRRTTLSENTEYSGFIVGVKSKGNIAILEVELDKDVYLFEFDLENNE